jgi:phage shock protein C
MEKKRLTRSNNRMVAGVCGGLADYFDLDPTLVRALYAILTFFTVSFPGIILYLILMLIMPNNDDYTIIR